MRAIVVEDFGSPEVLQFQDVPDPTPPPGGYVVQVLATAVNFADLVERRGLYKKTQTLPARLGKEAAGVVVARHPDAVEFEVGDPVIVVCFGNGCYAEQVAAGPSEVLRPPRGLSFVEMAAFGTAFATAWYSLHEIARVRPGESVLIQAAAGGVGSAAVILARTSGCAPVLGTAGGPDKCAQARAHGADACIDYRDDDFRPAVLDLTHGRGVDFCLESVGGETYTRSLDVLAPMGRLVIIGFSGIGDDYAGAIPRLHPLTVFHRSITVGGLNVDNLDFASRRDIWERLVAHAEQHAIRPVVGQVHPFAAIQAAHDALESRRSTGKVVLVLDAMADQVPTTLAASLSA
jgi:NADPH:quinone reductase-like Zn-dependent oxidoreductase